MDIVAPTALSGVFAAWILDLGVSGRRQSTCVDPLTATLLGLIHRHASESADWTDVFHELGTTPWARGWHDAIGVTYTVTSDIDARRRIHGLRSRWQLDGTYQLTEIALRAQTAGGTVSWSFPRGHLRAPSSRIS